MTNPNDSVNITHINDKMDKKGLTKREYFAAMAMQGLAYMVANEPTDDVASVAVKLADALINELNK